MLAFASKEAYRANAGSPEPRARHPRFRAPLDADPKWHDGEIVDSCPP